MCFDVWALVVCSSSQLDADLIFSDLEAHAHTQKNVFRLWLIYFAPVAANNDINLLESVLGVSLWVCTVCSVQDLQMNLHLCSFYIMYSTVYNIYKES